MGTVASTTNIDVTTTDTTVVTTDTIVAIVCLYLHTP